jgi:chromosome segregation ATPase
MMSDIKDTLKEGEEGKNLGGNAEDFEQELANNTSAFEALERDFQEVLGELMGDQNLEKFRLEYEKLHRALKKSHEQEKRLVKKCRELNSEIVNNQAKIKTALRLSQEDQKTITHLQKEMEKTWKLVYAAQEKETRGKETIAALKEEMANLSKLVEKGAGLSLNQENMVKELRQAKEELEGQLEEQHAQVSMMDTQLQEQFKLQEEIREERDEFKKLSTELKERIVSKESENAREVKRRTKTQNELMDIRKKLDKSELMKEEQNKTIQLELVAKKELERKLDDAKQAMEKYLRDYEALTTKTQKITDDLDMANQKSKKLVETIYKHEKEIELKTLEIGRYKTDNDLLERKIDKEKRSTQHYMQLVEEAKTPLALANAEVESLKKEIIAARRQELVLSKANDKTKQEKEQEIKNKAKAERATKEQVDLLTEEQRYANQLEKDVKDGKNEVSKLKKAISSIEKDRERLSVEATEQRNNFVHSQEELKLREVQIGDLVKKVQEYEAKQKQQQSMYEGVRADRNHYSKALVEKEDEVAELKKKFKILGHQIDQLKEEIVSKDQALVKEHFELQKTEKLRENIQAELNRKNQLISQNHDLVHQQDAEIKRLTSSIRQMDGEALAQRKEYDQVINERDILGTQLIRRNDELALLYEKLRVLHSALKIGESQYTARVDDIRTLKIKIKDLDRAVYVAKNRGDNTDELKREILQLQKELLQEKTKVTALSEELENPLNVHRWRKLEGSDPATFELIQKIQALQKRLISKTEEVVEKGLVIQEKERMYDELKNILARQPGPEVSEQLTVYQQNLKSKTRQLKAMASELNMYQAQVNEYKYEVERLSRELQETKRKYYQQKRKEQMVKDMEMEGVGGVMNKSAPQMLQNEQQVQAKLARTRYTGGGFAIKQPGEPINK